MIKRIGLLLAVAVLCFGQQAKDRTQSYRSINGRGWLKFSEEMRVGYFYGFANALATTPEGRSIFSENVPTMLDAGEICTALNRFYEDPVNLDIPVLYAMRMIKARAEGVDPARIERDLAFYRKRLAEHPPR